MLEDAPKYTGITSFSCPVGGEDSVAVVTLREDGAREVDCTGRKSCTSCNFERPAPEVAEDVMHQTRAATILQRPTADILKAAVNKGVAPEVLYYIAQGSDDGDVLERIAKNPSINEKTALYFANYRNANVVCRLTENESLLSFPAAVEVLCRHEERIVREYLSKIENLGEEACRILSADKSSVTRRGIAKQSNLPENIAVTLAADEDSFVKQAIAKRQYLSESVIAIFLEYPDRDVIDVLLDREDLSESVRQALAAAEAAMGEEDFKG